MKKTNPVHQAPAGMQSLAQRSQQQRQQKIASQQRAREAANRQKTMEEREAVRHIPQQEATYYGKPLQSILPQNTIISQQPIVPPAVPQQKPAATQPVRESAPAQQPNASAMKQVKRQPAEDAPLKPMEFYGHFFAEQEAELLPEDVPVPQQAKSTPVAEKPAPQMPKQIIAAPKPSAQESVLTEHPSEPLQDASDFVRRMPPRNMPKMPQVTPASNASKPNPASADPMQSAPADLMETFLEMRRNSPAQQTNLPQADVVPPVSSRRTKPVEPKTVSLDPAQPEEIAEHSPMEEATPIAQKQKYFKSKRPKEPVSGLTGGTSEAANGKGKGLFGRFAGSASAEQKPDETTSQSEAETPLKSAAFYQRLFSDFQDAPPTTLTPEEQAAKQRKEAMIASVKSAVSGAPAPSIPEEEPQEASAVQRRPVSKQESLQKRANRMAATASIGILSGIACLIAGFLLIAPRTTDVATETTSLPEKPTFSMKALLDGSYTNALTEYYDSTVACRDILEHVAENMLRWTGFQLGDAENTKAKTDAETTKNHTLPEETETTTSTSGTELE